MRDVREHIIYWSTFVVVLLAVTLPRCLFNMDVQDEGWMLTAYQNIFAHPSSVSYNFLYYNGILVGGLWNVLFGKYGLMAFRVLYLIVKILKALLVYLILRRYCNKWVILVGYALLTLCCGYYNFMDHNQLTALMALLAIFLLLRSLEKEKWQYMFAAGIVVALNVFTRLPNLSLGALILVLIPFWLQTRNNRQTLVFLMAAFGGFVVGCGLEAALMSCLGHWPIFIDNFTAGFAASAAADSTHNLLAIGQMTGLQLCSIACQGGVFAAFVWAYNKKPFVLLKIFLVCLLIGYIGWQYNHYLHEWFYAIQTLVCVYIICRETADYKYLAVAALVMLYAMPLGSDFGYESNIIFYAMCLSFPLAAAYLTNKIRGNRYAVPLLIALLFVAGGYGTYRAFKQTKQCVRYIAKSGNRYTVHSPLATTFIADERLTELNPLLDELANYVRDGDELLCFQSLPMVHYLTQTQPYLGNAWPWTYTSSEMARHFRLAQKENLPVIVREKGWVCDAFNTELYPNWDNAEAEDNRYHQNAKIKLIQDFIKDNQYRVVWENSAWQILIK